MRAFPLLALLLTAAPAHAQYDGTQVLNECGGVVAIQESWQLHEAGYINALYCMGYVTGVFDGARAAPAPQVCPPENSPVDSDLVKLVVDYLRKNPSKVNQPARGAVLAALRDAFPCPKR